MNASLVILFLVFHFTCHGKEQNGSPPSDISPTTKWQKKVEAHQEDLCPDPTDIEPCECITGFNGLAMNCSNVQDEEELHKVFSAFFPTTEFNKFIMDQNHGVKVLEDGVFGNVSFQLLDIDDSVLETVETEALTPSLSTLTDISISFCKLDIFPFERLPEFASLKYLFLPGNKIHTIPPLSSTSLQFLDLGVNLITQLMPDVFTLLTAVEDIYLSHNYLTVIPKGTFTGLPNLEHVSLNNNNISYLQSLTFEAVSTQNRFDILSLNGNDIEYVEVDAFKGVLGPGNINMDYNALTRLPEEVWRPVLEEGILVFLSGNHLACGCDVAWLVRDPQLVVNMLYARCADGTPLTNLNAADFDICG